MIRAAFRLICSNIQCKLREIQNEWWWTILAKRTQLCADLGDYRGCHEALNAVYDPNQRVQSLLQMDGCVIDKTPILSRWSKYFQALFSGDRVVQDPVVFRIPINHSRQNWMNYPLWKKLPKPCSS